jgi:CheY-like chemotaxis protein
MAVAEPAPAMILLDLVMPGMNGFAFLEEAAKHAATCHAALRRSPHSGTDGSQTHRWSKEDSNRWSHLEPDPKAYVDRRG